MGLQQLAGRRVVALPDMYVDAVMRLPAWPEVRARMDRVASRGGGNVPGGPVEFRAGGNAANLAVALARLGAHVTLVAHTDALGLHLLRQAQAGDNLDLDLVRTGPASASLVLEAEGANIMLSHAARVAEFGPQALGPEEWRAIGEADAVAVVNWAQNLHGTSLLEAVSRRAAEGGQMVFVDTGDPRNRADLAALLESPAWPAVHAWGMNGNEALAFAAAMPDASPSADGPHGPEVQAAQMISARLGVRVDLHTRHHAWSMAAGHVVEATADGAPGRRITGAGDAWNAGDIAGYLLGLEPERRLALAHRVATQYVQAADGRPPLAADLVWA